MAARKKRNDPFDTEEIVTSPKKGKKKPADDDDDLPFGAPEDDDFEYEDLREQGGDMDDDGEMPEFPEGFFSIVSVIEEYAVSEAENALWRAYAAVEDSPDIETAKKRIRQLIKKLG